MEGLQLQSMIQFPSVFHPPSCNRSKDAITMNWDDQFASLTLKGLPRRVVLKSIGFSTILLHVNNKVLAAPMQEMKEPEVIRTLKFDSGVRIQEIVEGKGTEAHEGDLVEVNYVCRRSNGYFVHSTVDQFSGESSPVILPLDDNRIIKGLKEVLIGMKVGGKRRALIPPSVGYINENLKPVPDEFGPRRSLLSHANEPLIFENYACGYIRLRVCEAAHSQVPILTCNTAVVALYACQLSLVLGKTIDKALCNEHSASIIISMKNFPLFPKIPA